MTAIEKQRTSQKPKPRRRVALQERTRVDRILDGMEIERLETENYKLKKILIELTSERLEAQGKFD
jgi:hypothetical protein